MKQKKIHANMGQRFGIAASFSLALHVFILALLFLHHPQGLLGNLPGDTGGSGGGYIYLSLAESAQETNEAKLHEKAAVLSTGLARGLDHSTADLAPAETSPDAAVKPALIASSASDSAREMADVQESPPIGARSNDPVGPGNQNGDQTILQQIAKCFPPGENPSLPSKFLDLSVDDKGELTVAPQIEFDPATSDPNEVKAANIIIQSALQCGPYVLPASASHTIRILLNFAAPEPN